ncbi:MAG: hypothetical protein HQL48_08965 [Gammaproteobacteria bacterium]|nr:hypothetical protein [Gammaproteobacteria bacterium]
MGKGAMLVHASDVIKNNVPGKGNYRTKNEILDVFDTPASHAKLKKLIDNYDYRHEGIMTLITSVSNATYFIIVKLQ